MANKDFEGVVAAMLGEAGQRFECLLFIDNTYPTLETQMKWSMECWEAVCLESQNYFDLSKTMMRLVSDPPPLSRPVPATETCHNRLRTGAHMVGGLFSNVSIQCLMTCLTWLCKDLPL